MANNIFHTKHGLLVKEVQIMSFISKDERSDLPIGIDANFLKSAVDLFQERKAAKKLPRLVLGHNKPTEEAPVIGRVVNMQFDGSWILGDILITNPEAQDQFKRGEIPALSAEFFANKDFPLIFAVAATKGQTAHFDIDKPDFMPDDVAAEIAALALEPTEVKLSFGTSGAVVEAQEARGPQDMAIEELAVRIANIEEALFKAGADKKAEAEELPAEEGEEEELPEEEESPEEAPEDGAEESPNPEEDEEMEELKKARAKLEMEAKKVAAVIKLQKDGVVMTTEKMFEEFSTVETEDELTKTVERLSKLPTEVELATDDGETKEATGGAEMPTKIVALNRIAEYRATGLDPAKAVRKLSMEEPEIYKAWTDSKEEG